MSRPGAVLACFILAINNGLLADGSLNDAAILIGLLLPPEEPAAVSLRQGVEIALEHANQFPGPKASLIIRGRPGQWGDDGTEAARMVLDDGARALIAPPSGAASHLSLQVAGRTAIPVVSLCGDASVTTAGIPWMVRLAPRTADEAEKILRTVAARQQPAEPHPSMRWAVCVPPDRPGREATRDLQGAAQAAGCLLLKPITVTTNLAEVAALAHQALASKPDAVLLWLDPISAGRLAAALRATGFRGTLAGPSRLQCGAFLKAAGGGAEGFLVPGLALDQASQTVWKRFSSEYQRRHGGEPDLSAALAYDAATLLVHVLRKTGTETPHRAFPQAEVLPGASGSLSFDEKGNRRASLNLLVCHKGRFTIEEATR
jgi:ABC-type branched-subunit amino acid transport system substrate-binding protein